ncbi:MAG: elongation factor 1-beta [Nanoarchaeota archaeon]
MGKAYVVLTYRVMPTSPELDIAKLQKDLHTLLAKESKGEPKFEVKPFAFGLKAVEVTFMMEESKGCDAIEAEMKKVHGVENLEVVRLDRALG